MEYYTIIILTMLIIAFFYKLRKKIQGKIELFDINTIPKDTLKNKVVLITSFHHTDFLEKIIKIFTDNEAQVIYLCNFNKKNSNFSMKNLTKIHFNSMNLDVVYNITQYLNKHIFRIDYFIYNSMEINFFGEEKEFYDGWKFENYRVKMNYGEKKETETTNTNTSTNNSNENLFSLSETLTLIPENNKNTTSKTKNIKEINQITYKDFNNLNPLVISNTLAFFLLLLKILPVLDRGEGRVINIIGDSFDRSCLSKNLMKKFKLTELQEKNFMEKPMEKNNRDIINEIREFDELRRDEGEGNSKIRERRGLLKRLVEAYNDYERDYEELVREKKCDLFSEIGVSDEEGVGGLMEGKKDTKKKQKNTQKTINQIDQIFEYHYTNKNQHTYSKNLEDYYNDTCLLNQYILKYMAEYVETHYENIIINTFNPGTGINYFLFNYLSTSYLKMLFLPILTPLILLLLRTDNLIAQAVFTFCFGKNYYELVNGGYYNQDCAHTACGLYGNNKISKKVFIKVLFNRIKGYFEKDEVEKVLRS